MRPKTLVLLLLTALTAQRSSAQTCTLSDANRIAAVEMAVNLQINPSGKLIADFGYCGSSGDATANGLLMGCDDLSSWPPNLINDPIYDINYYDVTNIPYDHPHNCMEGAASFFNQCLLLARSTHDIGVCELALNANVASCALRILGNGHGCPFLGPRSGDGTTAPIYAAIPIYTQ